MPQKQPPASTATARFLTSLPALGAADGLAACAESEPNDSGEPLAQAPSASASAKSTWPSQRNGESRGVMIAPAYGRRARAVTSGLTQGGLPAPMGRVGLVVAGEGFDPGHPAVQIGVVVSERFDTETESCGGGLPRCAPECHQRRKNHQVG